MGATGMVSLHDHGKNSEAPVTSIPTFGGIPTRGETYAKLNHHLIECQELAAIMSHLHNTEGNAKDLLLARSWLAVSTNFKQIQKTLTKLAMGNLQ
jgi:hypothetical protein